MQIPEKPVLLNVIAWTTLASGIVNLFWGFALSGTALVSLIGIICVPLAILPSVLGIFEIIYAAKLFSNPPQAVRPSTNIAVLEIASFLAFNVFSMVVGILALVFYNDIDVRDYFMRLNGTLPPEPVAPTAPVLAPEPQAAPVMEEPVAEPKANLDVEGAASESEAEEKPSTQKKRTSRKVSKK